MGPAVICGGHGGGNPVRAPPCTRFVPPSMPDVLAMSLVTTIWLT